MSAHPEVPLSADNRSRRGTRPGSAAARPSLAPTCPEPGSPPELRSGSHRRWSYAGCPGSRHSAAGTAEAPPPRGRDQRSVPDKRQHQHRFAVGRSAHRLLDAGHEFRTGRVDHEPTTSGGAATPDRVCQHLVQIPGALGQERHRRPSLALGPDHQRVPPVHLQQYPPTRRPTRDVGHLGRQLDTSNAYSTSPRLPGRCQKQRAAPATHGHRREPRRRCPGCHGVVAEDPRLPRLPSAGGTERRSPRPLLGSGIIVATTGTSGPLRTTKVQVSPRSSGDRAMVS